MKRFSAFFLFILLITISLEAGERRIPVYFFSDPHCKTCFQVKEILADLSKEYEMEIIEYQAEESLPRLRPLRESRGYVPGEIPIVLVGETILEGGHRAGEYREALSRYRKDSFEALFREQTETGKRALSAGAVMAAGLLDGINPCAFSVFVFLILFMAAVPKRKKVLLRTAAGFAAGVFLVYLALGLGLREVLGQTARIHWLKRGFYAGTGVFLLVGALLSVIDFLRMRKRKRPLIRIPDRLKNRITRLEEKAGLCWTGAFFAGGFVAWLELGCTGQIYFPVILSIAGENFAQKILLLLLYNIMFILPLLAVGAAALSGMSLALFRKAYLRLLPLAKLFMAIFFIILGVYFFSLL